MHEEALDKNTKRLLEALSSAEIIKKFYLAGGTALAFYYGHRMSLDLDWFAQEFSNTPNFKKELSKLGKLTIDSQDEKTLNGNLNGVKISFFEYPYPLVSSTTLYKRNIKLAGKPDIAVMKLDAIATRGTYKDFIDIYFLLKEYSLEQMLEFLEKKFSDIEYNEIHLLKSLIYFKDAEKGEMPRMLKNISWENVKKTLKETVENYLKSSPK